MPFEERRAVPRVAISLPLGLRVLNLPEAPLLDAQSVNLSERGLLFVLDTPLAVGTPFELTLTMPSEVTGSAPMRVHCTARVLRSEPHHAAVGRPVNAALIERYEAIVAEG